MISNIKVCSGHTRPVCHIEYSNIQDESYWFVSSSHDGKPMIRNGESGDWVGTFNGHRGAVYRSSINNSGSGSGIINFGYGSGLKILDPDPVCTILAPDPSQFSFDISLLHGKIFYKDIMQHYYTLLYFITLPKSREFPEFGLCFALFYHTGSRRSKRSGSIRLSTGAWVASATRRTPTSSGCGSSR